MRDITSQENIEELRKRLYARSGKDPVMERHQLPDEPIAVASEWNTTTTPAVPDLHVQAMKQPRRYRFFVLIGSMIIFTILAVVSGLFLFMGGNKISTDNITVTLQGNTTVPSAEAISLQASVTNENPVAIEDAVLVVKYPAGSRTVPMPGKTIFEERIPIGHMSPGETKSIPLQVAIFGKENEQKEIRATVEYRVTSSNGTFSKDAAPFSFTIISSPLVLNITSVKKIAAGQPVEITITAKSNVRTTLKDVLISASYPNGFTYYSASPEPLYTQSVWSIDELEPEESFKIVLKGAIAGLTEESFGLDFTAGLAESNNKFIVGSLLAEARAEFIIERPFIDVGIKIAGDADRTVVLEPGEPTQVQVDIKNTLKESVYDMVVEVVPSGTSLDPKAIAASSGFYDSNKGVIRFESVNNKDFVQVLPGSSRSVEFFITPKSGAVAASFEVVVNVYARRVADASAQEQLIGTVTAVAKYSSVVSLEGDISTMTGPIPPQVGEETKYLVTLAADAGMNDLTKTSVSTLLPPYVTWQDDVTGSGTVTYNPVTREVEWNIGDIKAKERKEVVFSVSILPSLSQIGITPVLVQPQTLTATDRFTGMTLSARSSAITTELSAEAGYDRTAGIVIGQ
jgi:hypothetical protein